MATTYRKIDEILAGNQRNNIVNPQGLSEKPLPEQAGFAQAPLTNNPSTGFAGKTENKPSVGQTIAKSNESQSYLSNANKAAQSDVLSADLNGQIALAKQKLKDNANAYVEKIKNYSEGFNIDEPTLAQLYSGDAKAYEKVQKRLGATFNPADVVDFIPDQREISDLQAVVDPVRRQAKLAEQFNSKFNGQYTNGMNVLDNRLTQDHDYSNVLQENASLAEMLKAEKTRADAQKATEATEFGSEVTRLNDTFNGKRQGTTDGAKAAKDKYLLEQAGTKTQKMNKVKNSQISEFDKLLNEIQLHRNENKLNAQQHVALVEEIDRRKQNINANKTIKVNEAVGEDSDFITEEQVKQYNLLSNLMGKGDTVSSTSNKKDLSVDSQDFGLQALKTILANKLNDKKAWDAVPKTPEPTAPVESGPIDTVLQKINPFNWFS